MSAFEFLPNWEHLTDYKNSLLVGSGDSKDSMTVGTPAGTVGQPAGGQIPPQQVIPAAGVTAPSAQPDYNDTYSSMLARYGSPAQAEAIKNSFSDSSDTTPAFEKLYRATKTAPVQEIDDATLKKRKNYAMLADGISLLGMLAGAIGGGDVPLRESGQFATSAASKREKDVRDLYRKQQEDYNNGLLSASLKDYETAYGQKIAERNWLRDYMAQKEKTADDRKYEAEVFDRKTGIEDRRLKEEQDFKRAQGEIEHGRKVELGNIGYDQQRELAKIQQAPQWARIADDRKDKAWEREMYEKTGHLPSRSSGATGKDKDAVKTDKNGNIVFSVSTPAGTVQGARRGNTSEEEFVDVVISPNDLKARAADIRQRLKTDKELQKKMNIGFGDMEKLATAGDEVLYRNYLYYNPDLLNEMIMGQESAGNSEYDRVRK